MDKYMSRKFLITVVLVVLVAAADLLGQPLTAETLDALLWIAGMGIAGLATTDSAEIFKKGNALAEAGRNLAVEADAVLETTEG